MPRGRSQREPDLARNAAYFLGALGCALGAFGALFAMVFSAGARWPAFFAAAPDWVYTLIVLAVPVLMLAPWFLLDWLTNRHPRLGSSAMVGLAVGFMAIGSCAFADPAWASACWLALAGGVLLLPAAYLAARGGGTTPLEWASLRTPRAQAFEARLHPALAVIVFTAGVAMPLMAWGADGSPLWLVVAVVAAIAGLGWLPKRRP